jgi:hypothetical protein
MTENFMYGRVFEGGEVSPVPEKKDVEKSGFRVSFYNFGNADTHIFRGMDNFGGFVTAISLPVFRLARPSLQECMEGKTDDVAEWANTEITFRDDRENEMIRQVMAQITKQTKKSKKDQSFTMVLDLLHPDSTLPYRMYLYRGCKIAWAGHEDGLDKYGPTSVPFMMQVKSERIEIADSKDARMRERWMVAVDDDPSVLDINDQIASLLQQR